MRWPTTVGGWQDERAKSGHVYKKFKESPTGQFYWRDLVAAPVWYPPASTPDGDLMMRWGKTWKPKESVVGPGYRSAFGLVMLVHETRVDRKGKTYWLDDGVRSHGSGDYRSVMNGQSHGCHRLSNHLAVRLSAFLLATQEFDLRGPIAETWARSLTWHARTNYFYRDTRGFLRRFIEPISVLVKDPASSPRPPAIGTTK